MAWHSKRHNIKHRKAAQDAKKAKIYAKVSKVIQMAATRGDNPSLNPALDAAIKKGKQVWLSKEAIQKAVDKWAWNDTGEVLSEIFYEWYGPGGVALYIKCVTPNTNRSGANVRALLAKYGGNLWEPWSVSRQFQEKGEIYVPWKIKNEKIKWKDIESILPFEEDEFEEMILETDAEDYEINTEDGETMVRIVTSRDSFMSTVNEIENAWRKIESSDFAYLAENTVALDEVWEGKLVRIIDMLEDDEDVDTIWHNAA